MDVIKEKKVLRMPPRAVRGYAAKVAGLELKPFTYEPPKLKEYDVRVSVTHCGVCYSEIYAIDDYFRARSIYPVRVPSMLGRQVTKTSLAPQSSKG